MADCVMEGVKSFPISANIAQYLRVKASTGAPPSVTGAPIVSVAGAGDVEVGVTLRAAYVHTDPSGITINDSVAVRLSSAQGTIQVATSDSGSIAIMAPLYRAASGYVTASATATSGVASAVIGYNLTCAASFASGDVLEMLPV